MNIIGVIPARYKSSRFPGKPLADISGRPMIWWVYQQCKKVEDFSAIYVATDDKKIFETCKSLGLEVIMTSEYHKTGTDRVGEVATKIMADLYVNVQGDEPVIKPEMIKEVIKIFDDKTVYFGSLRKEITDPNEILATSTVYVQKCYSFKYKRWHSCKSISTCRNICIQKRFFAKFRENAAIYARAGRRHRTVTSFGTRI